MKRRQRTYEAIVTLLRDGRWHPLDELKAATQFPQPWVDELHAEGVVEVNDTERELVLVRLRAATTAS